MGLGRGVIGACRGCSVNVRTIEYGQVCSRGCIVMQANSKEKVKIRKEMVKTQGGNSKEQRENQGKTRVCIVMRSNA